MEKSLELSGKSILIMGGNPDLRDKVTPSLRREGASVSFLRDVADSTGSSDEGIASADFSDPDSLRHAIGEMGIEACVVLPGWSESGRFMSHSPAELDHAIRLNLEHMTWASQAAAKRLIELGKGGAIVFVSSVSSITPMVHTNLAGSTLAAIEVIARMAAVDLAQFGIRVNTVAAGWGAREAANDPGLEDDIPMGIRDSEWGLGDLCAYLIGERSARITGTVIPIDGGFLLTKSARLAKRSYN